MLMKKRRRGPYHHVRVIHNGIDVVCCLDKRKATMPEGDHTRVHANAFIKNISLNVIF